MGTEEILKEKIVDAKDAIAYFQRDIDRHIENLTDAQAKKASAEKEKAQFEKDLEIIMKSRQNKEE